ncbi:hypothetical protein BGZ61DRAFT_36225 [Ilyonectria robusta]|uniref:uncharacterized protein n=1 Tax=Ilyonectria robusta TaxID=1079257 RepID=UPI001E8D4A36|nr:uncharacterized protein BGZ61DRAFT_36225 [Ilyonectria robusta]KAH8694798.1 hypothetical protein BGZ61DRAFT_36225 [Ilyonectria robusta]
MNGRKVEGEEALLKVEAEERRRRRWDVGKQWAEGEGTRGEGRSVSWGQLRRRWRRRRRRYAWKLRMLHWVRRLELLVLLGPVGWDVLVGGEREEEGSRSKKSQELRAATRYGGTWMYGVGRRPQERARTRPTTTTRRQHDNTTTPAAKGTGVREPLGECEQHGQQ